MTLRACLRAGPFFVPARLPILKVALAFAGAPFSARQMGLQLMLIRSGRISDGIS